MTECRTYTAAEVADLLGVSAKTVYEAARAGELPGAIRLGRRVVFSRAAIDALLETSNEPVSSGSFDGPARGQQGGLQDEPTTQT